MASIVAVLFSVGRVGCNRGPQVVTSIEFDGNSRSIATKDVVCTKQLNGGLVILVDDGRKRTVRIQLTQQGRLVVQRAGRFPTFLANAGSTPSRRSSSCRGQCRHPVGRLACGVLGRTPSITLVSYRF
jgi:hypothetical protein